MGSTAGFFEKPEGSQACEYVLMANGKWYHKDVAKEMSTTEATGRDDEYLGVGDVNSDERGSGARYNNGKPPMHYIPFRQQLLVYRPYFEVTPELSYLQELLINLALFEQREISISEIVEKLEITDLHDAAYVWDYGAQKYAAYNWAKGMKWSVPMGCISRHVQAILMGEDIDDESGCKHWGHIVCNLLMLEHYYHFFKEGDDRPNVEVFRTS